MTQTKNWHKRNKSSEQTHANSTIQKSMLRTFCSKYTCCGSWIERCTSSERYYQWQAGSVAGPITISSHATLSGQNLRSWVQMLGNHLGMVLAKNLRLAIGAGHQTGGFTTVFEKKPRDVNWWPQCSSMSTMSFFVTYTNCWEGFTATICYPWLLFGINHRHGPVTIQGHSQSLSLVDPSGGWLGLPMLQPVVDNKFQPIGLIPRVILGRI